MKINSISVRFRCGSPRLMACLCGKRIIKGATSSLKSSKTETMHKNSLTTSQSSPSTCEKIIATSSSQEAVSQSIACFIASMSILLLSLLLIPVLLLVGICSIFLMMLSLLFLGYNFISSICVKSYKKLRKRFAVNSLT